MANKVNSIEELKLQQDEFYQAIFFPHADSGNVHNLGVVETEIMTQSQRIDIYRNSILGGMSGALTNIYPVCVKLLGETYFTRMVAGYLREYPSHSPDLGGYGHYLSEYIEGFEPAKEMEYLPNVAKLELLWHKAFNAAEDVFSNEGLRALSDLELLSSEEHVKVELCLRTSIQVLTSNYPVHRIWEVNQPDYVGEDVVDLAEGGAKLVVWRTDDFTMRVDVVSDDEFRLVESMIKGMTFDDIAQLPFQTELSGIVQNCINRGLIVGFRIDR